MTINQLLNLPDDVLAMSPAELHAHCAPYFPHTRPNAVGNLMHDSITAKAAAPVGLSKSAQKLAEMEAAAKARRPTITVGKK